MIKKISLVILALGIVFAAKAEDKYLYWMVDTQQSTKMQNLEFSYATVRIEGSDSYLNFYNTAGEATGTELTWSDYADTGSSGTTTDAVYAGGFGDASAFAFELWLEDSSGNGSLVGWAIVSREALSPHIYSNLAGGSGGVPYVVGAELVPEPSSALLLLIGLAALGLKRKVKRKKEEGRRRWSEEVEVDSGVH